MTWKWQPCSSCSSSTRTPRNCSFRFKTVRNWFHNCIASVSECTSRNVNVQKYSLRFSRSIFRTVNSKADRLFIRYASELFLLKQGKARRERGAARHATRSRTHVHDTSILGRISCEAVRLPFFPARRSSPFRMTPVALRSLVPVCSRRLPLHHRV